MVTKSEVQRPIEFSGTEINQLIMEKPLRDPVIGQILDDLIVFDETVMLEQPPNDAFLEELRTQITNVWRHNAAGIFYKRREMGIDKSNIFTNEGCGVAFEHFKIGDELQTELRIVVYANNLYDPITRKYFRAILAPSPYPQRGQFYKDRYGKTGLRLKSKHGKRLTRNPISDSYGNLFRQSMRIDIHGILMSDLISKYISIHDYRKSEEKVKTAQAKREEAKKLREEKRTYGKKLDVSKIRIERKQAFITDFEKHKLPRFNEKKFEKGKHSITKVVFELRNRGYTTEQVKKYVEVNQSWIKQPKNIGSAMLKAGYYGI